MENQNTDEDLLKIFNQMSPFKSEKPSVSPFLTGLGRHVITKVQKNGNRLILQLRSEDDECQRERTCELREIWCQTAVEVGDVINVLAPFDSNGFAVIDNNNGLIVVNPDHLISGTSVVSSLFCMRKSVLTERFHCSTPANSVMVCGRLIHQIFQEIIQKEREKNLKDEEIKQIVRSTLEQIGNLHSMLGAGMNEHDVMEEIELFLPKIKAWIARYFRDKTDARIDVTTIQDIEENIWSPRYGIKGKIDLTVEVKLHKKHRKIVPLELKTGKSSFSPEHEGQVILYSMMCSDRREDPAGGLLVYLRDGQTKEIAAEHKHKQGLMQLRNELIFYLDRKPLGNELGDNRIPLLPEPLNNRRLCRNCPSVTVCCLYKNLESPKNPLSNDHDLATLIDECTQHLSQSHKEYFLKWQFLLSLEAGTTQFSFLKGIYCQPSKERQDKGLTYSQMRIGKRDVIEMSSGFFLMKFDNVQDVSKRNQIVGITPGDLVVVSCEATKEFAIASGNVVEIGENFITAELDKNLSLRSDFCSAVFRLDRYSLNTTTSIAAGNLALLIQNDETANKLRRLIIDRDKPRFIEGLPKDVLKGKKFLKTLNSQQLRAVFRALMAEDYFLIKGMPGTGKTCVIVALIRFLAFLGYTVLLTSYTHSAVDNICLKLKPHGINFLRLGKLSKIHPDIHSHSAEKLLNNTLIKTVNDVKIFYETHKIIVTTCLASHHVSLYGRRFDFCVVDEACQIMQIACLGPIFHADRFILIGDPLQLPPLIQNKAAKQRGMDESLFARLDCSASTVELSLQYRMNSEIMHVANKLVYNDTLRCGSDEVSSKTIQLKDAVVTSVDLQLTNVFSCELKHSVLFLDTDNIPARESYENQGIYNEIEARIMSAIVRNFLKAGITSEQIGLISFYSRQVSYLRRIIGNEKIETNTVDQYQGRDKEIVLVSFVRSTTKTDHLGEILQDMRRLNVAITRAKHKFLMIGSRSTLINYGPVSKLLSTLLERQIVLLTKKIFEELCT